MLILLCFRKGPFKESRPSFSGTDANSMIRLAKDSSRLILGAMRLTLRLGVVSLVVGGPYIIPFPAAMSTFNIVSDMVMIVRDQVANGMPNTTIPLCLSPRQSSTAYASRPRKTKSTSPPALSRKMGLRCIALRY